MTGVSAVSAVASAASVIARFRPSVARVEGRAVTLTMTHVMADVKVTLAAAAAVVVMIGGHRLVHRCPL